MIQSERLWRVARERNKDMMCDAEQWRLSHSSPQPTWPAQQIRGLLCQLGWWLDRIGRLQRRQMDCWQHERLISYHCIASRNPKGTAAIISSCSTRDGKPIVQTELGCSR